MTSLGAVDAWLEAVAGGRPLSEAQVRELAAGTEILPLGMLADAARRQRHGQRASYLRVASVAHDGADVSVPGGAGEVEITGAPSSADEAVAAVVRVRAGAGGRPVSAFGWADVQRLSGGGGGVAPLLARLKAAGLDALSAVPMDETDSVGVVIPALAAAGFTRIRLAFDRAPAAERLERFFEIERIQQRLGCIQAIDPLPRVLQAGRPTTGYEDVKMIALARLAAPHVPTVQLDWRRYGPKLAQVGLTFGADDLHGVSASDEAPEGRRRAPLEEIRRNIDAAGFVPVERDGRFEVRG